MPYTILVTGSRDWTDRTTLHNALVAQWFAAGRPEKVVVIHGNARGADKMAGSMARSLGFDVRRYFAPWKSKRRSAGPIRNAWMVKQKPDVCLAFIKDASPGATGCAKLAEDAGIETFRFTKHRSRKKELV